MNKPTKNCSGKVAVYYDPAIPLVRIIGVFALLMLAISVVVGINTGQSIFAFSLMSVIGLFIGPFMGITYPFNLGMKLFLVGLLFGAVAGIGYGLYHRKYLWGQALTLAGLICWTMAGWMGLATGT